MSLPWEKVVTDPLGVAAFALFLVFSYLGKVKQGDKRRWLSPVAFLSAITVLIGGLGLAYREVPKPVTHPVPASTPEQAVQQTNRVHQITQGPGSPNVQGVQGNVTITIDQSTAKTELKPSNAKK